MKLELRDSPRQLTEWPFCDRLGYAVSASPNKDRELSMMTMHFWSIEGWNYITTSASSLVLKAENVIYKFLFVTDKKLTWDREWDSSKISLTYHLYLSYVFLLYDYSTFKFLLNMFFRQFLSTPQRPHCVGGRLGRGIKMKARGGRWEGGSEEERPFPSSHRPSCACCFFFFWLLLF